MHWVTAVGLDGSLTTWLIAQGLAPYAFYRLKELDLLSELPENVRQELHHTYYEGAALNLLQRQETAAIIKALSDASIDTVVLKGTPLAYSVYPDPLCRLKGDLDVWLQPDQVPSAVSILQGMGYRPLQKSSRPRSLKRRFGGEQQMVSAEAGTGLIELQWPAIRGEWVRYTTNIDHRGIWSRRTPIEIEGQLAYTMAPEDMLIHLCVHQAVNHYFRAHWLRALLDVHLLVREQPLAWTEIVQRAQTWRVATTVWVVLDLAQRLMGTDVPHDVLTMLSPSPWRLWVIRRLRLEQSLLEMWPGGYRHWRFVILLSLIDRVRDIGCLLWRGLFPEKEWLQARYSTTSAVELWRARLLHLRLLISARR